jgi:hypothetical protein
MMEAQRVIDKAWVDFPGRSDAGKRRKFRKAVEERSGVQRVYVDTLVEEGGSRTSEASFGGEKAMGWLLNRVSPSR